MTTETILVLVDGWIDHRHSVGGADSGSVPLRNPHQRGQGKHSHLRRPVPVVTIHASGVPVVIQQRALGCVVRICRAGERMPDLRGRVLAEHVRRYRRKVRPAIVAGDAVLLVGPAQQPRRPLRIVRRVAADARILRYVDGLDDARLAGVIRYRRVSTPEPQVQALPVDGFHLPNRVLDSQRITIDGEDLLILTSRDVLAKVGS